MLGPDGEKVLALSESFRRVRSKSEVFIRAIAVD